VVNPANGQIRVPLDAHESHQWLPAREPVRLSNFSQQARDYLYGTARQSQEFKQHVVARTCRATCSTRGPALCPLRLGCGIPLERSLTNADPVSATSGFYVFNSSVVKGDVKVTEGYLETAVPLVKNKPAIESLELNGAVRVTDYKHRRNVTTMEVRRRVRAAELAALSRTHSRDTRAPNTERVVPPADDGLPDGEWQT